MSNASITAFWAESAIPSEFSLEFNSINGLVSTIVIRLIDTHTKYAMNNVKLAQPADVALALVFFATLII